MTVTLSTDMKRFTIKDNTQTYTFNMCPTTKLPTLMWDPETRPGDVIAMPSSATASSVSPITAPPLDSELPQDSNTPLTPLQIESAQKIRALHKALGHPSDVNLALLLKGMNSALTATDIASCKRLFGPCEACEHGKGVLKAHFVERIPATHIGEHLYADLLFVKDTRDTIGVYHFVVEEITSHIYIEKMQSQSALDVADSVIHVEEFWRQKGKKTSVIFYDDDRAVNAISSRAAIELRTGIPNDHQVVAERYIRVCRERIRATLASLPFLLPSFLYGYLLEYVAASWNATPNKKTAPLSPNEVLGATPLRTDVDATVAFGDIIRCNLVHPDATVGKRVIGLVVRTTFNHTGKAHVYVLSSGNYADTSVKMGSFYRIVPDSVIIGILNRLSHAKGLATTVPMEHLLHRLSTEEFARTFEGSTLGNVTLRLKANMDAKREMPKMQTNIKKISSPLAPPLAIASPAPTSATMAHQSHVPAIAENQDRGTTVPVQMSAPAPKSPEPAPAPAPSSEAPAPPSPTPGTADPYARAYTTRNRSAVSSALALLADVSDPATATPPSFANLMKATSEPSSVESLMTMLSISDDPFVPSNLQPLFMNPKTRPEGAHAKGLDILDVISNVANSFDLDDNRIRNEAPTRTDKEREATEKEIKNILVDHKTLSQTTESELTHTEWIKRVYTRIFTTLKRDNSVKARGIAGAGGKPQDRSDYPEGTWSPCVKMQSLSIMCKVTAVRDWFVNSADVRAAYLNANLKDKVSAKTGEQFRRVLEVKGDLAQAFMRVKPDLTPPDSKGRLFFFIEKALYGLMESGLLWYEEISEYLLSQGLKPSTSDPCIFHGDKLSIALYVDDFLVVSETQESFERFQEKLAEKYGGVTCHRGPTIDYIGIDFSKSKGRVEMSMASYLTKMLAEEEWPQPSWAPPTPASGDLFLRPEGVLLSPVEAKKFTSLNAKILHAAAKVRGDVLMATNELCGRNAAPTQDDAKKQQRLMDYLFHHRTLSLGYDNDEDMRIYGYVDASYGTHHDGKSHTGAVISIGNATLNPVKIRSFKQKLVARSTTEAELIGVHDCTADILWAAEALEEWGYEQKFPAVLFQDNLATIFLAHRGHKPFSKMSHVNVRYFSIKDLQDRGYIEVCHKGTKLMVSDSLTKVTSQSLTTDQRDAYMNLRKNARSRRIEAGEEG